MNPFILNLETKKSETGLLQPSSRILEKENFQDSEFAKILKSQIMEQSAHKEEAIEKENQRNSLPEEPVRDEEFLEDDEEKRFHERAVLFSHEMKEKAALLGEKKEIFQKERRTAEINETGIVGPQKELKVEKNRSTENEASSKIRVNIESQKVMAEHAKKGFGEPVYGEKSLNEPDKLLENGIMSKRAKNAASDELKTSKTTEKDLNEESAAAKSQKEIKLSAEKLKNQKISASDGEKAKTAAVAVKAAQENNEQPLSKTVTDTLNTPKTEISADAKNGHAFQFNREGQFFKTETANKLPSAPQARPGYNFQEQLQSLLDNAKVYVKDGKNGSFHVNLYPKSLGSISMNLGLEQGVLNGRFLVENADAKEALLQNFDSIRQQLEESGITVGEFHVNVKGEKDKYDREMEKEKANYKVFFSENEEITAVYEMNTANYHKGSINMVV